VPLEHTAIDIGLLGPVAALEVVQRFRSHHSAPLDALYVFPLPSDAAIHALELRIGPRLIRGAILPRAEAEAAYSSAATAGATAALLGQERPNLFSVELANLPPGAIVEVRMRCEARVPFDDGAFTFTLPTVTLPRYLPPDAPASPRDGVLPMGAVSHTLALHVELDAGRLAELASPSHEIDIKEERTRRRITLRDPAAVPDRDFVLRYRPAGDGYDAAAFTFRAPGEPGALLLTLTPRAVPQPSEVLPRELLFVFDRSGSMGGESIAQARNALRACLRALNPADTFNIFPFDNHIDQLAPLALPFTQASVDAADRFIDAIQARGGTEILGALQAALAQPRDSQRLRVIVFLTDGAVGNETAVLRALASDLNEARVFAFGVGSAVNRFLLDQLAAVGRGSVEYILPGEPIAPAVQRFQRRAALPLIHDLELSWGDAAIIDALPSPLPDLYAGQPLVVLARFSASREQRATLVVRGRTATGRYEERLELDLPQHTADRSGAWAALPRLWARARLAALEDAARLDPARAALLDAEARELALAHGLLSAHTSFVAVEELAPGETRQRAEERVVVPVHLPAGMRPAAAPAASPPPRGVLYAAAPMSTAMPRTPSGMAARFRDALRAGLNDPTSVAAAGFPEAVMQAPQAAHAAPAGLRPSPTPTPHAATPAERREAALRFLARTQRVDGSWGDDERLTGLALLAFAQGGHTSSSGDFRPQLARAQAWLAARGAAPASDTAIARAEAALSDAGLSLGELIASQRLGGDDDGAATSPLLTAALAILA
jgi:Ca-activated chloride channel family protein